MKTITTLLCILLYNVTFSQTISVEAEIVAEDLSTGLGRAMIYSLEDSTLVKGTYIDSSSLQMTMEADGKSDFYLKLSVAGYSDTTVNFRVSSEQVHLGKIVLLGGLALDEVSVTFVKPTFERTMDGVTVNVDGTTLQELNSLFDVLKASPRLTSPDDESIEIIGRGSPLILVDRQAIISNDELKAIPANQVDRIEIITSPSAKYKAQGSGNGVIEVYTKNYSLEGYRVSISADGGLSTQYKPQGRLSSGLNFKRKKFTLSGYLGVNYSSRNSYGSSEALTTDTTDRKRSSSYASDNENIWQYYNLKGAYELKESHRLTMGVSGYGSNGGGTTLSTNQYFSSGIQETGQERTSTTRYTWLNNSAFMNYTWETDTNNSVFEVNLNYVNKVSGDKGTYLNDFTDHLNGSSSNYDVKNTSSDRPNIGEIRVNYEHHFDTTTWQLDVGSSYSMLLNGKQFDRSNFIQNEWVSDPVYSNKYNYQEHIGAVFAEVSKNWDKFGFRAGIRGEYTQLNGYSEALQKQIMDSSYVLPFPTVSLLFSPNDTIGIKLYYSSGIDRPQFSNYDPFIRIEDSLNIQYGNPYLRPSYTHSIGAELDLFYAYNLTVSYSYTDKPSSTLSFIRENSFITESTPWNADYEDEISVSMDLPVQLPWLQGWNSVWFDYRRYYFTSEFERDPFRNITYGLYSYLNFILPAKINITNRLNVYKYGDDTYQNRMNYNWGVRITKKFLDNDLHVYFDVSDILPRKYKTESYSGNYQMVSTGQYVFTSFKFGLFYKFGRLKAAANIQESSSGQSNRL